MRRWKISTMMTSGTVTTTPAAIWEPNGVSNPDTPPNWDTMTGAVFMSCLLTIVTAMRNSFHALIKTMMAVVKMPGAAIGMMTLRKA